MIEMINADCMDYMASLPDKAFDLAIIDPPYGIGEDGKSNHSRGKQAAPTKYKPKAWDKERPPAEYFQELMRVSKNQIIWGGNYFADLLPPSPAWVIWDKVNGNSDFADCELAWTSFKCAARKLTFMWNGFLQGKSATEGHLQKGRKADNEKRRHPTQKPTVLYKWLLSKYAQPGWSILDTHGGSGTICQACHDLKFDLVWIEKDEDYFNDAVAFQNQYTAQLQIF